MEEKKFNIKIHGIDILERSLFKATVSETDEFNFNIKCQVAVDEFRKLLVVVIDIQISKINEGNILAKFVSAFGFEVEDFESSFEKISSTSIKVFPQLDSMLQSVAISTMRGIIYSDLRGTVLHKAIMPIILMDTMKPTEENLIEKIREKV